MKLASILLATALVVASLRPVNALDCGRASLEVERVICNTPELKKADAAMSAAYFKLLRQTRDPEFHDALMRSQQRWIEARSRGVPRIDGVEGDDIESDDRTVLLKMTSDRLKFLKGAEPIRVMEQQRKIASDDGGGLLAGYEADSCEFMPPRYGNWQYVCWTTTHRQHNDRICSFREEWAAGHWTEHRLVSIINNGEPKAVANCHSGYAGLTCPDPENIEMVGPTAHWNTNPHPSDFDLRPPHPGNLWKYDPDGPSGGADDPWMRDCLSALTYPPPDVSRPDPFPEK